MSIRSNKHTPENNKIRTWYVILRWVALGSMVFSLTVFILLLVNFFQLKRSDPFNSPAMQTLIEAHHQDPKNDILKEQIRELDQLARRAYFSSRTFSRQGAYLLVIGLGVMLACLKTMTKMKAKLPDPRMYDEDDLALSQAAMARWQVTLFGLFLLVLVMALSSTYRSFIPRGDRREVSRVTEPIDFPAWEDFAQHWPSFRGPGGRGFVPNVNAPVEWNGDTEKNIRWKVTVPKRGYNSPVAWANRVFLTGADTETRNVYCFDAETGNLLWDRQVKDLPGEPFVLPKVDEGTGYAAQTAATDGEHVFAMFATGELVCLDFDGNLVWGQNLGVPENHFGHASSLMVFAGRLLMQIDEIEGGRLIAVNTETGDTIWEKNRNVQLSWATPVIAPRGQAYQIILNGNPMVSAYDFASGKQLWGIECMEGEVAPSPAYGNGKAFFVTEYAKLTGVDCNSGEVLWTAEDDFPDVASPVATEEFLFLANSYGSILCFDINSGDLLWKHEFDNPFYASPIILGERLYVVDHVGVTRILKASDTFELVNECALGEGSFCTPAYTHGRLYIRGEEHLYCIEETDE